MSEDVFAYGSNMCLGRFLEYFSDYQVTPVERECPALLHGYRLSFNKQSQRDGSGKANVEPHIDGQVWGVLYTIFAPALLTLDNGEGGYRRDVLPVETTDGVTRNAWVYVARRSSSDVSLRPYTWYKRFLVEGARAHGLPAEYIEVLERIDANEDADRKRDRENRALRC